MDDDKRSRQDAEIANLIAETLKLNAEMVKLQAETAKLMPERQWYMLFAGAALTGAIATLTKLFF